jgi:hypothetical protein
VLSTICSEQTATIEIVKSEDYNILAFRQAPGAAGAVGTVKALTGFGTSKDPPKEELLALAAGEISAAPILESTGVVDSASAMLADDGLKPTDCFRAVVEFDLEGGHRVHQFGDSTSQGSNR